MIVIFRPLAFLLSVEFVAFCALAVPSATSLLCEIR